MAQTSPLSALSAVSNLPDPSPAVEAHGRRVAAHIHVLIDASKISTQLDSGSISFADFMRAALYAPGLGYYSAGATKLGAGGDFVTAPEMSPFFGAALADAFAPLAKTQVLELGAGSGKLARDFLAANPRIHSYSILEVSPDLRERQQTLLAGHAVTWLNALPDRIEGLVIANEVLDAVPCEIVRFHEGRYEQARVRSVNPHGNGNASAQHEFFYVWQPLLQGPLLDAAKHRIPPIEGYTTELNLEAEALVATLAARLTHGALCFIDYGFPRREYYLPDRRAGTLACHYQQRVHFDPLILVGLQDITAHVDFTAMAEAAVDNGCSVISYASQAQFLVHTGLLKRIESANFSSEAERATALGAVQKLLSPAEMGELFKVLIVGKGDALDQLAAFSNVDQSYRL
jgi:SAM-dependent MidA family methyltransferase